MHDPDDISVSAEREREVLDAAIAQVPPGDPIPGWLVHRIALSLRRRGDAAGELELLTTYRNSHGDAVDAARFRDREQELRRLLDV